MTVKLPVDAYVDEHLFQIEQDVLSKQAPIYVGHEKMLPNIGSYMVSERSHQQYIFIKNHQGTAYLSNMCRHHQALLLKDKGEINSIICPFHRWQYDMTGQLKNAPKFDKKPCVELYSWNELYFTDTKPLIQADELGLIKQIDFSEYVFHETIKLDAPYNWKIFVDTYLDDYHVPVIHPGLRSLVNVDELTWAFKKSYSIQQVQTQQPLKKSTSTQSHAWMRAIEELGSTYEIKPVMWMLIYPYTMIEVYPFMITISSLDPVSSKHSINYVDFLFDKRALERNPKYPEIAISAYLETAKEDDELCISIQKGKENLAQMRHMDLGIHHANLESGITVFHQYLADLIPELFVQDKKYLTE